MPRFWVSAGLIAAATCLPTAAGAADYARTRAYEKTVTSLAAMVAAGKTLSELRDAASPLGLAASADDHLRPVLPGLVLPAFAQPKVSIVAMDLILSQLALQSGANYHVALRQAQARPEVLLVESGVTSLAQLYDVVTAAGLEGVLEKTDTGIVSHLPIAVWSGATLALQPEEVLELDRETGAFLVVSGSLLGQDATIRGAGAQDPRLKEFNPFVVIALSGNIAVQSMRFSELGFGLFPPLTGVTVIEGGFYRREQRSSIRDSRFDNVGTLALLGTVDAAVSGNVFANAKGPSLLLDGGSDTEIAGNFILGGKDAHGIKVTGGGKDIALSANLIVAAGLNGIFADAGASDLMIEANVIAGSGRSGVSVASADCIALSANLLLQNKHSGLAIRDSAGLSVTGNRFIDNGTAGISITHQPGYGRVLISSNELDGNRVGIKGSTTATLEFAANDFSAQAPRLLDGELVQFTGRFLDFSGSGAPTTIAGLDLKGQSTLTPSGALRPTSCSFPKDV